ncbi:prepilin-type N-terminal cleavage/methylation domain-containing protein [Candidatus Poribacteria bacterium]|nr:prepilin-type N-terminal cleavage/methylation domain-containing protein [Candidatus Poribacteria bacterium]
MIERRLHRRILADGGFTLIELLIAMAILTIISSVAYSSFVHVLNSYQRDTVQLDLMYRLRIGLDQMTRDLASMQVGADDDALQFVFQDAEGEAEGESYDIVTFVATVTTAAASGVIPPLSPLPPSQRANSSTDSAEEDTETAPTDVVRVAYVLGYDPEATISTLSRGTDLPLALLRITTPILSLDDGIGEALTLDPTSMLSALEQVGATVDVVAPYASSLNFAFFDGEEWYTQWDTEEQGVPKAARVTLTVQDRAGKGQTFARSSATPIVLNIVPPPEGTSNTTAATGQQQQGQTPQAQQQPGQQQGQQPQGQQGGGPQQGGPQQGGPQQGGPGG